MTTHVALLLVFFATCLGIYGLWWFAMGWINGSTWP
jgi:hypothetical protein